MSMSQEERTLGGLAHLGVLFGLVGVAFQVILLVVYLPKSKFVASHAKQALGLSVTFYLVRLLLGLATGGVSVWVALNPLKLLSGGFIGSVLLGIFGLVALGITALVLVIMAMIKGFNGQEHRYPVVGDLIAAVAGE